jgi:hypothetical protein
MSHEIDNLDIKYNYKDYETIKKEFTDSGCTLLSEPIEYNTYRDKLRFICDCGTISTITYFRFRNGFRCGCNNSTGENKIKRYLTLKKIKFTQEKSFADCKAIKVLHFDFYVEHTNKNFLIEFDGQAHFKSCEGLGNYKGYETSVLHDNIKNKYCIKNNIKLLRISYNEIDEINKILDNYIAKFDKLKSTIMFTNKELYKNMKLLLL